MADPKLLWMVFLTILTLANVIASALKIIAKKNNPNYGERIATLEKGQEGIEDRLDKLEKKINKK